MSATTQNTSLRVATLLRDAYPDGTAKRAARAAGVSARTTEAWVSGRREPSASVLLRMAARCEAIADALERTLNASRAHAAADRRASSPGPIPSLACGAPQPVLSEG